MRKLITRTTAIDCCFDSVWQSGNNSGQAV